MSDTKNTFPRRGFALFEVGGKVEVRTVTVTAVFGWFKEAQVREAATGAEHTLPLARVASESTLAEKRAAFGKSISATAAKSERLNHTAPVMTTGAAVA